MSCKCQANLGLWRCHVGAMFWVVGRCCLWSLRWQGCLFQPRLSFVPGYRHSRRGCRVAIVSFPYRTFVIASGAFFMRPAFGGVILRAPFGRWPAPLPIRVRVPLDGGEDQLCWFHNLLWNGTIYPYQQPAPSCNQPYVGHTFGCVTINHMYGIQGAVCYM